MKYSFLLVLCLIFKISDAQNIAWQNIAEPRYNLSAVLPGTNFTRVDTLDLLMYSSLTSDSMVSAQLFVYNNYALGGNQELVEYMQQNGQTDTLKTIARFMVAQANGELIYFKIWNDSPATKTMDIGIRYANMNTNILNFTRFMVRNKTLILLNVFGQECFASTIVQTRDLCNNSLLCH
jgi:hypothetical protein